MAGFENYKNVIINVSEWLYWTTDIILYEFKYNTISTNVKMYLLMWSYSTASITLN